MLNRPGTPSNRSTFPLLNNLHKRVEDDPHRREQQPEDQHREPAGEDDVVERPGLVVPGEGVDLRTDPGKGEDRPRDPEEDQRATEADEPHDAHQHPDAVGDRVLLVLVGDVVGDRDRDLGHLQAEGGEVGDHVRLDVVAL